MPWKENASPDHAFLSFFKEFVKPKETITVFQILNVKFSAAAPWIEV